MNNEKLIIKNGRLEIRGKFFAAAFSFLILNFPFSVLAAAQQNAQPANAVNTNALMSPAQYNMIEPFLNRSLRDRLEPAGARRSPLSSNQAAAHQVSGAHALPLSNFARPNDVVVPTERRVVSRDTQRVMGNNMSAPTAARAATRPVAQAGQARAAAPVQARAATPNQARAAAPTQARSGTQVSATGGQRQVVQRARTASRFDGSASQQRENTGVMGIQGNPAAGHLTPEQCLANYVECMDNYCHRPNTRHDRCFCSARLQQLDNQFRPAIDELLKQISIAQTAGINDGMTEEEINEYWNEIFGATGRNSMANLTEALNISWIGTESSVRGQNAFVAGDTFCRNHLTGCFFMAENMRSMYRTMIGQDCRAYETYLQRMKSGAQQILRQLQQ